MSSTESNPIYEETVLATALNEAAPATNTYDGNTPLNETPVYDQLAQERRIETDQERINRIFSDALRIEECRLSVLNIDPRHVNLN